MRIQRDETASLGDETHPMCFVFVLSHLNIGTF